MRLITLFLLLFSSESFSNEWIYIGNAAGNANLVPANDKLWAYVITESDQEFLNQPVYKFQYRETEGGILINAFCDAHKQEKYLTRWVEVYDGGNCYFQLKYNPKKQAFSELWVNGEA